MGIDTTFYKLAMLSFGAALAGLAGALEAHLTYMVSPAGYGFSRVVEMLVQAVVGGTTLFFGPAVGAAFLTALPEVLREIGARTGLQPGAFRLLLNGLVLLAVILFLPNGLVSLPERRRARALRKKAQAVPP
jgi:branched-chain amino acid transport system permease protein